MTSITNPNAWVAVDAPIKSDPSVRKAQTDSLRAAQYVTIAKQFNVETNPRYVKGHDNDPKNGIETYCNIYLCDVMLALGVTLPHWQDPATGAPTSMGKGAETNANGVCLWLERHALEYGWMECGEGQARGRASVGYPTVVVWKNTGGIGHVAVVLPGSEYTHVAQAGGDNFFDGNMRGGFGGAAPLKFYSHD